MILKLFGFKGRIGRGMWWLAQLVAIPIIYLGGASLVLGLVAAGPAQTAQELNLAWGGSMVLILIATIIIGVWINFSSTIQRYHDRGKSGFWSLMLFVPFIGFILVIIECGFCSGDDGHNKWGPPPGSGRAREDLEQELDELAATADSGDQFAKLDDKYFRDYASQMQRRAPAPAAPVRPSAPSGDGRPIFGKRGLA
jgi:uncharacterized membrane protein YhaH (DUF805 family)